MSDARASSGTAIATRAAAARGCRCRSGKMLANGIGQLLHGWVGDDVDGIGADDIDDQDRRARRQRAASDVTAWYSTVRF